MADHSVLERLVEYILLELLEAQDASNKASAKLAERYLDPDNKSEHPNLEFFPIPNSSIKSFDFVLKFALKDIGIILSDDAISELSNLIVQAWEDFLEGLFNNRVIVERRKSALHKDSPHLDFTEIKSKAESSDSKTIATFLEREILELFVKRLPSRVQRKKEVVSKCFIQLNLSKKINEILFKNSEEQAIALPDLKAVFDVAKLNDASGDIICNINVHVEMRNFASAYNSKIDSNTGEQTNIKFLTLKS